MKILGISITQCVLGVLALAASDILMAACPTYLQGEYRQLHSTKDIDLCKLVEGKPVLVVNTASHCGFTKQFKGLEALSKKYEQDGLVVVGFASDDFNQEAKDEAEAATICFENFGVTFTMFAPTHVRGEGANPLFEALAKETSAPKWNFNKYLLGRDGKILEHFGSSVKPDDKELMEAIEKVL